MLTEIGAITDLGPMVRYCDVPGCFFPRRVVEWKRAWRDGLVVHAAMYRLACTAPDAHPNACTAPRPQTTDLSADPGWHPGTD